MVGVAGEDGGRPIELLGENRAGKAMGQRQGSERQAMLD
jgi:hypothetical protein